jgi:hypothetical protein
VELPNGIMLSGVINQWRPAQSALIHDMIRMAIYRKKLPIIRGDRNQGKLPAASTNWVTGQNTGFLTAVTTGLLIVRLPAYDQNGNTLTESGFDGLGNYRNDYIRMDDGRLSEIRYNTQGRLKEKRVFTYSGNGTYISVLLPDNSVSQKITLHIITRATSLRRYIMTVKAIS